MGRSRAKVDEICNKLLRAISRGNEAKLQRLIEKHGSRIARYGILQRSVSDSGDSLLHIAASKPNARHLISCLVGAGSSVNATDLHGCTPLHAACDVASVQALLKAAREARQTIRTAQSNAEGLSVQEIIERSDQGSHKQPTEPQGSDAHSNGSPATSSDLSDGDGEMARKRAADEAFFDAKYGKRDVKEEDAAWRARLADEMFFEFTDDPFGGGGSEWGEVEAGEDWFSGVAAQVERRRAEERERARAAREREAARREATRRRFEEKSAYFAQAEEQSAGRQKQWRDAERAPVAEIPSVKAEATRVWRERYVQAWSQIQKGDSLSIDSIPWPCRSQRGSISAAEVALVVLPPQVDAASQRRKILMQEMRRWHPDKFMGRYNLWDREREAVLQRVKECSQALNQLLAEQA